MDRNKSEPRNGTNPNPNDHEPESARINPNTCRTSDCEPVERKLWNPEGIVICRSCNSSRWSQSLFGYSHTGLIISALLCRECYDIAVVRHVKYDARYFILAAYYVATRNSEDVPKYEKWKPNHQYQTMASLPTFSRLQPALPRGFRQGKLW